MSDTPRTDEVENFIHYQERTSSNDYVRNARFIKRKEGFVLSQFARQLERELTEANRLLDECRTGAGCSPQRQEKDIIDE
jgi:hypothetical protein